MMDELKDKIRSYAPKNATNKALEDDQDGCAFSKN
jgi:hypothetical protein